MGYYYEITDGDSDSEYMWKVLRHEKGDGRIAAHPDWSTSCEISFGNGGYLIDYDNYRVKFPGNEVVLAIEDYRREVILGSFIDKLD